MGRNLSLLALLPRADDPALTDDERREARQRRDEMKAQAAAERALLRKREGERLKRQEVTVAIDEQVRVADQHLRELRQLDEQLRQDQRLNELWRLRRQGWSLADAMADIDRRYPGSATTEDGRE